MEIRTLGMEHLEEIIELDEEITGENHTKYFENHFQSQLSLNLDELMFGVFENDRMFGFLLASIRQLAFGQHQRIAYLEMIEVNPQHQKMGIGTVLMKEFQKRLKELEINRVITLVNWKDSHLLNFFKEQGMEKGDMVQLELNF